MAKKVPLNPSCSFCGKSQDEVQKLIAGPSVYICNECVRLCNDIVEEDLDREEAAPLPRAAGTLASLVQAAQDVTARAIGLQRAADFERAMQECPAALERLDRPGPASERLWFRYLVTQELSRYCRAAAALRQRGAAVELLSRWRPRYLPWLAEPHFPQETELKSLDYLLLADPG